MEYSDLPNKHVAHLILLDKFFPPPLFPYRNEKSQLHVFFYLCTMHINEKFINLSTHKTLFDSNMITNCQRDIYKEFFFMATFFPICLLFTFQVEANLDIFFASVVLFLASPFGNLWRKKSIIISLSFFLGILNSKQTVLLCN